MIRQFPKHIIENIKSYLEIWEKLGISKQFISKIQDQLEWPRDINGYANSSISYYSNIRLQTPIIDLYLGNFKLVKAPYTFNFKFKEKSATMGIYYNNPNIQHILNAIWFEKPFPNKINVFKTFINVNYIFTPNIGYQVEASTVGEAQLLNHFMAIVKRITN
jgi:hypothetical protein